MPAFRLPIIDDVLDDPIDWEDQGAVVAYLPTQAASQARTCMGERRLLRAMVSDAIRTAERGTRDYALHQHVVQTTTFYNRSEVEAALGWITCDRDEPFTFIWCCRHLFVCPYRVRRHALRHMPGLARRPREMPWPS